MSQTEIKRGFRKSYPRLYNILFKGKNPNPCDEAIVVLAMFNAFESGYHLAEVKKG